MLGGVPARRPQLTADSLESSCNFLGNFSKPDKQHRFLGIYYDVHVSLEPLPFAPHGFPQAAFDAITLHCPAQHPGNSEANPRPSSRSPQKEKGHVAAKMPLTLLVDAFEISVPQQARC